MDCLAWIPGIKNIYCMKSIIPALRNLYMVIKEKLQGIFYGGKRELTPGNFVFRKKFCLDSLNAGHKFQIKQRRTIEQMNLMCRRQIHEREKAVQFNVRTGFLGSLA